MDLTIHRAVLTLRHPFGISRSRRTHQTNLVVALTADGLTGYGECGENAYYEMDEARLRAALERARPVLKELADLSPEAVWPQLATLLADNPFALCALDEALWDLWAQRQGRALHDLWDLDPATAPPSSFTIGLDAAETMCARVRAQPDWPIYKIKLGGPEDLRILEAIRGVTTAPFRVDANAGWDVATTRELLPALEQLGVELVEQPLPVAAHDAMPALATATTLPFAADESCVAPADVARCEDAFAIINIKLMKCGGLTPARQMIRDARARGLRVMLGCMIESSVGISALAALAPLADYVDMDGANLISNDPADGAIVGPGTLRFRERPGLGIRFTPAA